MIEEFSGVVNIAVCVPLYVKPAKIECSSSGGGGERTAGK